MFDVDCVQIALSTALYCNGILFLIADIKKWQQ
jgi:hypothetical protein